MAEIENKETVYLEIENGIIVGHHSADIDAKSLPEGSFIIQANVEDPDSLLGLTESYKDVTPTRRPTLNKVSGKEDLRWKLRSLSIEIDLALKLKEDTTELQEQFNTLSNEYKSQNY